MIFPTDLGSAEQAWARARLVELAGQLTVKGELRSPRWREVFERTWRHPYVPAFHPDRDTPAVVCFGATRQEWLDAVYSDTTLITKLVPVPLSRALRPAMTTMYVSSCTLPSLVVRMLEQLDVAEGQRVLEIGTGSGYTAALLCERLGSAGVTSVDLDDELIELARERLAANGYTPTLAAVDGEGGYPDGAPYDRILSTCAVSAIPPAWLTQAAPGAVILTDVHGPLGGTVARLRVEERGTATGRFAPYSTGFMTMRHHGEPILPHWPRLAHAEHRCWTRIDPNTLAANGMFGFVVQWQLPDATRAVGVGDDGQPALLLTSRDGSHAEITTTSTARGYLVRQYGPRRLWDQVERAAEFWENEGRPSFEHFGITATPEHQYVWYDNPDGTHRWLLPARPATMTRPNPTPDDRAPQH